MGIISRMRKQTAVLWTQSDSEDHYSEKSFSTPVEIECRWEDVHEEYVDFSGERSVSNAIVYVDRVVLIGAFLKKGSLSDLSDPNADPDSIEDAYRVAKFEQLPNLKNTETLYTAIL